MLVHAWDAGARDSVCSYFSPFPSASRKILVQHRVLYYLRISVLYCFHMTDERHARTAQRFRSSSQSHRSPSKG